MLSKIETNYLLGDTPRYRRNLTSDISASDYVLICTEKILPEALDFCQTLLGYPPVHLLDYTTKCGENGQPKHYNGIEYVPLSNFEEFAQSQVVFYGPQRAFFNLALKLARYGILEFHHAVTDWNILKVKHDKNYIKKNYEKIRRCLYLLQDDESRRVLCSVLKYRVTGDHGYIRISRYQEYVHPVVNAVGCDWIIDGGAFNGNTSFMFADQAGEKCTVIAVEPDRNNQSLIQQQLSSYKNIILEPYALGRNGDKVFFNAGKNGSSAIVKNAGKNEPGKKDLIEIHCISLEEIAHKNQLKGRGLISLDVEGAETFVIRNDIAFLKQARPLLQISIYHRQDDLIDILLFLSEHLDHYHFYMGHHTSKHTETDLYCIPRECAAGAVYEAA